MSKTALKKELLNLTKEQLVAQILDLYSKNKAVKTFYDFYLNPTNEKELLDKCKKIIRKEFNVEIPQKANLKFSVAKKAITELKDLQVSSEIIADAMLYLAESACEFTAEWGDMDEAFYVAAWNNYKSALKFIAQHNLLPDFKRRAEQCVKYASPCGYGFADDIADVYYEYYHK
ncbi:DUF6155 family protein [Gelidibacter sp.]|uniref:DUF6155 family protein n=1 Tax=Gelidibacter sp. TaxID=2018083 RepID=UPI003265216F